MADSKTLTTQAPTISSTSVLMTNISVGPSTSSRPSNPSAFTTPSSSPVLATSKHDIPVGTIVGSVFGATALIMLLAIGLIFWRQRVKRRHDERDLAAAFSSSPDMAFNDRSFLYNDTSRYVGYSQAGTSTPPRRTPYSDVDADLSGADMATSAGFEEAGYNAGIATDESRPPSYPATGHGYGRQVYGDPRTSFSGVPQSAHEGDDEEEAEEKYPEEKSPEMMRELERELQFRYD
ncbi:hypothetical protein HMN09_00919500 [Mycena chlorophos]|uniref:Uncharacterized protein n=1 Tax=Mycena chlorophos TaxID=658473 RepID=A0A8H6W0D3_MYCCL|nr:hypothetical protein HMN09_00919500 [Mycena chlorophos]